LEKEEVIPAREGNKKGNKAPKLVGLTTRDKSQPGIQQNHREYADWMKSDAIGKEATIK